MLTECDIISESEMTAKREVNVIDCSPKMTNSTTLLMKTSCILNSAVIIKQLPQWTTTENLLEVSIIYFQGYTKHGSCNTTVYVEDWLSTQQINLEMCLE
jgi:hypothetical protein